MTALNKIAPTLGDLDLISEENITPEVAEVITARQKHETQKAIKTFSSLHADQAITDIILRSRLLEEGSITNEDVKNRNFENKSAMTLESLQEELSESKNELQDIIDSGNLSFRERVQYKDLLSLMNRYEKKFSDNFTYNALLIGDVKQFSESIHFSLTDPEYKRRLLDNDHELTATEKAGFKLTQMANRVNSAIDVAIDSTLYNVRENYYQTKDGINRTIDNTKKSFVEGVDSVKSGVSSQYNDLKDGINDGIDSFKSKALNALLKAKAVIVKSANAALFTAALGYYIAKSTVDVAVENTANAIDTIKEVVTEQAKKGYDKGVALAEGIANKTYDASIYTAAVSVVAAKVAGHTVAGSGKMAASGVKKIGKFIKDSKENFNNAVNEESQNLKSRNRSPSI